MQNYNTKLLLNDVSNSLKSILITVFMCCWLYTAIVLIIGQVFVPLKAEGSLIHNSKGEIVGSQLLAQKFTKPGYFWSRPSAVDYNASGSGGSNLSPTNPVLRQRIQTTISKYDSTGCKPIPADLVMASGSGLDPFITVQGAIYQSARIAKVRGIKPQIIEELIIDNASKSNNFLGINSLINVLELNILLDSKYPGSKHE
jgi:K+-transporting ATPase ATPase C chain